MEKDIIRTRYFDPYEAVDYGIIDRVWAACLSVLALQPVAFVRILQYKLCEDNGIEGAAYCAMRHCQADSAELCVQAQ